jgi:tetratricopeptide (TPR) repeat protein
MSTPADFRSIVDLQQAGQLAAAGRPQEALPCLEAAVRLEPGTPQPLCLLGALCHTLGRLEQAAASYRQAVAIALRLARAYNNLALVLKEQGDPDGAVAVLRSVLSFMPDYATRSTTSGRCWPTPAATARRWRRSAPQRRARSRADIERAREGFHLGLAELEAECDRQPDGRPEHLLAQLAWVNFPLAYQGQDDRELR